MSSYLEFLNLLIAKLAAIGAKAPQLMLLVQHIIADFREAWELVNGQTFAAAPALEFSGAMMAEVQDAEGQVIALCQQPSSQATESFGAIGDGSFLRNLYALIVAYPDLLKLIMLLLKA